MILTDILSSERVRVAARGARQPGAQPAARELRGRREGRPVEAGDRPQHAVLDRLVYGKLRAAFGGRLRFALSGGAPLGERLGHFFDGAGVTVRAL